MSKHLRITLLGALAALAVAVPAAQAKPSANADSGVQVCNSHRQSDKPKQGNGRGLVNAAEKSPALEECPTDDGGDVILT